MPVGPRDFLLDLKGRDFTAQVERSEAWANHKKSVKSDLSAEIISSQFLMNY